MNVTLYYHPVACSAVSTLHRSLHKLQSYPEKVRWLSSANILSLKTKDKVYSAFCNRACVYQRRLQFLHSGTLMNMENSNEIEDPKKTKIGIIQMNCTADKEANFLQAKSLIHRSKIQGAQMVFLPECFDYVAETQKLATKSAETLAGDTIHRYQDLAREQNLWLSLGGFHNKPEDVGQEDAKKIFNTHVLISSDGDIKGQYSKVHLFDVDIEHVEGSVRLKETDFTKAGTNIGPPVSTPAGRVGLGICYDLRFPEFSTVLTQQGAEILTYPSAFTVPTGRAHWEVLLRCRAIENQTYVVAAAQIGQHNSKRSSYGHAMVVDPWGKVIAECADKPDTKVVEIDLDYLRKRRREMPVWNHRRPDLYGNLQIATTGDIASQPEYTFGQVRVLASQVFYKSALSMAFVNKKPFLPGHVLISPIRRAARLADLTSAEVSDLFQTVQKVQDVMERFCEASSSTIAVQDGPDAGQTIQHIHVHVLPRKPADIKKNDDIYSKLEQHDKEVMLSEWRTDEEMSAEAATLRHYIMNHF